MAFNPQQFKPKKKRAVPNIPRPNLFSHEKKLKEQTEAFARLMRIVEEQQRTIDRLNTRYENLQNSIERIISHLSRK